MDVCFVLLRKTVFKINSFTANYYFFSPPFRMYSEDSLYYKGTLRANWAILHKEFHFCKESLFNEL